MKVSGDIYTRGNERRITCYFCAFDIDIHIVIYVL